MSNRNTRYTRKPGRMDGGASWISYSDMMAAMLLVFVLLLCYNLYRYYTVFDIMSNELKRQATELIDQGVLLDRQQTNLQAREDELLLTQHALVTKQQELEDSLEALSEKEAELVKTQALLTIQQMDLDDSTLRLLQQQQLMDDQQLKLDTFLGVRTQIIQDLSQTFTQESLRASVDITTGNIIVESTVFFDTNKADIKESGRQLLNRFIPVYLNVLLRPEYSDYLGAIIVEGHTDTQGTFLSNLELSQRRALAVVTYCLNDMPGLSQGQRTALERIISPTGRSYSSPIYNADGTVNMEQSRRVEFKFSLKDTEMIEEINRILSQ